MPRAPLPGSNLRQQYQPITPARGTLRPPNVTRLDWIDDELARLQRGDLLRRLPPPAAVVAAEIEVDGQRLVNFTSNDYLALAADERLVAAAGQACREAGVGRGASPLVSGRAHVHETLQRRLAAFEHAEAALLFPSGYAANTGAIAALVDRGDAVYADAKNHASLIDGCRLSRADKHVYRHGDVDHLRQLLEDGGQFRRRLIVTDTLFSMDGDLAPLPELADLADQYDAMLMVDEAHATGVFGQTGRGAVEFFTTDANRLDDRVDVRVGTMSKALGAAGGFVCGSDSLVQWLANRARSFVFSTAHPAATSAAAVAAVAAIEADPSRGAQLLRVAAGLREQLVRQGWDVGRSASQIVPIYVGDAARAVRLSARLREHGFWVPAIRPPSVPPGESLLRISLSVGHTPTMLQGLLEALGPREPQGGRRGP